jgi:uncharacterized protein (TIGR02421 family)
VGTVRIVQGESAYLIGDSDGQAHQATARFVQQLASVLTARFGGFLLVEIWSDPCIDPTDIKVIDGQMPDPLQPLFAVLTPPLSQAESVSQGLGEALRRVRVQRRASLVRHTTTAKIAPAGMPPLLSSRQARQMSCVHLGLAIRPIYQQSEQQQLLPLVLRTLRRGVTTALRQAVFEFSKTHTSYNPVHYLAMGPRGVSRAVWEIDRRIADVAETFDFLVQVTPINLRDCWAQFRKNEFKAPPRFLYRGLHLDPAVVKRRLYDIRVEATTDPAFETLFREKRGELDRKLTMLSDLNTKRFLYGSLQLFGAIDRKLARVAEDLLVLIPPRSREAGAGSFVSPQAFARRAQQRLAQIRSQIPQVQTRVELSEHVGGMMVSQGNLYIARDMKIPAARCEALLAHELETHVLTYYNGATQRFRHLRFGLAGYDELQEGLAVLGEYLVGGLSRPRLRLLAARVLAAKAMVDGADFIQAFRELVKFGFAQREAFTIAMRIFRGGGLTKDAVYLRGLVRVLAELPKIDDIELLFAGKFALEHLPLIREMHWRKLVYRPAVRPLYLDSDLAQAKLARLKQGAVVTDLLKSQPT